MARRHGDIGRDAPEAPQSDGTDAEHMDLSTLYVYLTDQCNLLCKHCWINPSLAPDEAASMKTHPEVFEQAVGQAKELGLRVVKFTGGEPLLYPGLPRLVRFVAELGGLSCYVESNGTLVRDDLVHLFAETKTSISVSIDGANASTHDALRGVPGAWERATDGAKMLADHDVRPGAIACLHRGNLRELEEIVLLVKDLGCSDLKLNFLIPMGRGQQLIDHQGALTIAEIRQVKREAMRLQDDHGFRIVADLPCSFSSLKEIGMNGVTKCPFLNLLSLLANGDITFCGFGYADSSWVMGNIHEHSLADVWQTHPLLTQVRQQLPGCLGGVCGRCLFRETCLGKCRANAFFVLGDWTAPDPLCQALYEEGTFPLARLRGVPEPYVPAR
jgi:SynChlorMet cassette radical SAM/SPASM protein ScmF